MKNFFKTKKAPPLYIDLTLGPDKAKELIQELKNGPQSHNKVLDLSDLGLTHKDIAINTFN